MIVRNAVHLLYAETFIHVKVLRFDRVSRVEALDMASAILCARVTGETRQTVVRSAIGTNQAAAKTARHIRRRAFPAKTAVKASHALEKRSAAVGKAIDEIAARRTAAKQHRKSARERASYQFESFHTTSPR